MKPTLDLQRRDVATLLFQFVVSVLNPDTVEELGNPPQCTPYLAHDATEEDGYIGDVAPLENRVMLYNPSMSVNGVVPQRYLHGRMKDRVRGHSRSLCSSPHVP